MTGQQPDRAPARRLPEWRYHVRRTVAILLVATVVLGVLELVGVELCDGPTCDIDIEQLP